VPNACLSSGVVHVIVVGCGRVGSAIATSLVEQRHSVVVVDRRASAFERLGPDFGGTTVVGVGFDRTTLNIAGIDRADALAAVTSGDNSNILIARVARETFGVERVVARIYDPRRAAIYQRLGISTVATVAWTTERVLRRLVPEDPGVEWIDASATVCLVERPVPPVWAGKPVGDLEAATGSKVAVLSRLGVGQVPPSALLLQDGDVLHLSANSAALHELDRRLHGPATGGGH
jgi:trk system potassium uptake protein